MKKERIQAPVNSIVLNEGQIPWLPENPRQWTREDVELTKASLKRDPDFQEDNPLKLVKTQDGKLLAFAGNLRTTAAKELRWKTFEAILYTPETADDEETIRRRALLDNGSFGSWDYDRLADKWNEMPFKELGIKVWANEWEKTGLSTAGKEGGEGYDEFVEKFEQKLTTDDCYTPPAVYDAVLKFVGTLTDLSKKKVERPFFPGGDYEKYPYNKSSIVVDNPPFSILSKILRFYSERNIPFFLFAPSLTLFAARDCDLTYIVTSAEVVYENGAVVRTGFITNIVPDLRIWCCPEISRLIDEAQPNEDKTKQGFVYPDNIVTAAILGKLVKRDIELKIRKVSCEPITQSDSAEEQGRELFGGGFIMSDRAAAERAAAERAAATRLNLSDREKAIIQRLNEADKD
jgi:hypothetical protein